MNWLSKYIEFKGLSVLAFEKTIETRSTIGKAIANNSNLRSDILAKILEVHSDINPFWLVTGKGNMLKDEKTTTKVVKKEQDLNADEIMTVIEWLYLKEEQLLKVPMYQNWIQNKEKKARNLGAEEVSDKLKG